MGHLLSDPSPGSTKKPKKMKSVAILLFIGLSMASARSTSTHHQMTYKQALKAKSIQCDLCTFVITELDQLLVADSTEAQIIEQVEKLCTALDGVFAGAGASCNALVEPYLPQIIEGLVNNQLSPSAVCSALTLCSKKF